MTFIAFVGLFQYSTVFLVSFKATSARKCQIFALAMFLEFWNKSTHKLPVWLGRNSKILFPLLLYTFIEQNIFFSETYFAYPISEQKFTVWLHVQLLDIFFDQLYSSVRGLKKQHNRRQSHIRCPKVRSVFVVKKVSKG